ncbi:MAG: hypothetical protein ACJ8AJ_14660 [Gemmatimonadaceae bacterium]
MTTGMRVVLAIAILLLIVAIRTVFVGYDSYTPVLFAQYYIGLFAFAMIIPAFKRMADSVAGDHLILLTVGAVAGAWLFALAAPQIGEPNYCGGRYLLYNIGRVPRIYRCTSEPFGVAGFFAGWWVTIRIVEWWADRMQADPLAIDAPTDDSRIPDRILIGFAAALAVAAVYKLFSGSPSLRPLLFAEIYLGVFALFVAVPSVIRSEQSPVDPDRYILYSAALVGAVVFWNLAPQIGEPNFCMPLPRGLRVLRDLGYEISRTVGVPPPPIVRPKVFHCTSMPFAIAGGFAAWWIALLASERWKSPPTGSEAG